MTIARGDTKRRARVRHEESCRIQAESKVDADLPIFFFFPQKLPPKTRAARMVCAHSRDDFGGVDGHEC